MQDDKKNKQDTEKTNRVIKFLDGFSLAVPYAYSDAIAKCQFEEGDIFYDSKDAYQEWTYALSAINKIVQVQSSPKVQTELIDDASSTIFAKNWHSLIDIEIISINDNQTSRKINTTQGRLFTYLIHGYPNILELNSGKPEIPILLKDAKKYIINNIKSELEVNDDEANKKFDETIINRFKGIISNRMEKPNFFVMLYDCTNDTSVSKWREIFNYLSDIFNIKIFELSSKECAIPKYDRLFPTINLKCIAIDSGKSEAIRDIIKKILWPKKDDQKALKAVSDILKRDRNIAAIQFKLSRHGIFYSFKLEQKKDKGIRIHSFKRNNHFIRYRVSLDKLVLSPKNLQTYLKLQFTDCPNHLFTDGDFSASKVQAKFEVELKHSNNHELITFARKSRDFTEVNSRHENLEKYLLDHDNQCFACEVPVWIESGEFKDYHNVFKTMQNLTGHIDLLRYNENGKIEIWDYKPGAFKDKKAKSQVFLYAFMLATRTGISLKHLVCGYFDEIDVFYFYPSKVKSFEL